MTSTADFIAQSSLLWLMGTGLVLGALHALEPGHSKTMMASFIVATRGTVSQAVLLGLSAALSHSLLIWVLAAAALYSGDAFIGDTVEPWLQLGSGMVIVGIGLSMWWRQARAMAARRRPGAVGPQGGRLTDTGHGHVEIAVFEDGVPPQFQLFFYGHDMRPIDAPAPDSVSLVTTRPDGTTQRFGFAAAGLCLASTEAIPEPHEFSARLSLSHAGHAHAYAIGFTEDHAHDHGHDHAHDHGHDHGHAHDRHGHLAGDAHARAHARQIDRHFDGRPVSMRQIALFGLSSGLMPCPAALSMVLVCLRLKKVALGIGLVTSFSLGLAATMVCVGVVAAFGVQQASRHLPAFGRWMDILPYVSGALVICVGMVMGVSGYTQIA